MPFSVPVCVRAVAIAAALLASGHAFAADVEFAASLEPAPMTMATRANLTGTGMVSARLADSTLSVTGTFSGLASPATGVHLHSGLMTGVPGPAFADLTLSGATSGNFNGSAKLTRAQLQALNSGALYVQIDSEKAPEPDGTLRGWLLNPQR